MICKIDPPPPDWMTFEIKTVMKEKFGANSTPTGGKASDIPKDYIKNSRKHIRLSTVSIDEGINEYRLLEKQQDLLNIINNDIKDWNIAGFKLEVGIDNIYSISGNKKYDSFYIIEELSK